MFFFLVEDWLSVENERNSGRVEKVILASCKSQFCIPTFWRLVLCPMWHSVCLFHTLVFHVGPQELQQFRRVLQAQLLFGLREHHLWISLWERPAHSSFSRAQRVTCCCLLLHLYLAAGAVWYGAVGRKGSRYLTWTSKGMKNILSLYYRYSGADRSTGTGITPYRRKQFMFFTKIQKSVISSSNLALTLRKKYEIFFSDSISMKMVFYMFWL